MTSDPATPATPCDNVTKRVRAQIAQLGALQRIVARGELMPSTALIAALVDLESVTRYALRAANGAYMREHPRRGGKGVR